MWEDRFLDHLAEHGVIDYAARHAGVTARTVYRLRIKDEDFALDMEEAISAAVGSLEAECDDRARDLYNADGKLIRKGSDLLLIFRLKALLPHKYRDNWNPSGELDEGQIATLAEVFQAAASEAGLDTTQERLLRETLERRMKTLEASHR
jgi:hypothetical protein